MKIKIDERVYVQKYDIAYIMHEMNEVPALLMQEFFEKNETFIMTGFEDSLKFACVFEEPENVRFLMRQTWIVDFEEFRQASPSALKALRKRLLAAYQAETEDFDARDDEYRNNNRDEFEERFSQMQHKEYSFALMIKYLKRRVTFVFPDEYART